MTAQELKEKLNAVASLTSIGINVFFIMKDTFVVKKANIANEAAEVLINAYKQNICNMSSMMGSGIGELSVLNLSDADDRASAIYRYDLNEKPPLFNSFVEIASHSEGDYFSETNSRVFNFKKDKLNDIDAFVTIIGHADQSLMVYRKNYSVNLFKRDRIFLIKESDTRFDTMRDDFIRLDAKIDFIRIDGEVFICNLDVLEKFCGYDQIITKEATDSIRSIETLGLVSNIEVLSSRLDEIRFARKLTKVSKNSPVFNISQSDIIKFTKTHPFLKDKFKYSSDGSQIELNSKRAQDNFIKLLNDDFLHSELTKEEYESPSKNKL